MKRKEVQQINCVLVYGVLGMFIFLQLKDSNATSLGVLTLSMVSFYLLGNKFNRSILYSILVTMTFNSLMNPLSFISNALTIE